MRKNLSGVLLAVGCLSLVVAFLTAACYYTATDQRCYIQIHDKLSTDTGLTSEGVKKADIALAAYLRGEMSLEYEDEVYGVNQRVFSEREITHMADVLALFQKARAIGIFTLFAGAALCAAAYFVYDKDFLGRACAYSFGFALGLAVCLAIGAIAAATNFSGAFLGMHALLFDNELWLMDPKTDLMIRLLPQEFFVEIAKRIALSATMTLAILVAASGAGIVVRHPKRKKIS